MRIGVYVFFDFKSFVLFFQHNRNINIYRSIVFGEGFVVLVFYIAACKFRICFCVHIFSNKCWVHIFNQEKTPVPINQWLAFTFEVVNNQRNNSVLFGYPVIVGTKSGSDVYNSGSIFGGNKFSGNYTERISFGFYPVYKLFVINTFEFCS